MVTADVELAEVVVDGVHVNDRRDAVTGEQHLGGGLIGIVGLNENLGGGVYGRVRLEGHHEGGGLARGNQHGADGAQIVGGAVIVEADVEDVKVAFPGVEDVDDLRRFRIRVDLAEGDLGRLDFDVRGQVVVEDIDVVRVFDNAVLVATHCDE